VTCSSSAEGGGESKVDLEGARPVKEFESHKFIPKDENPIVLVENRSKSVKNRLGYLYAKAAFTVDHPEHEPLKNLAPGVYEVRRTKTWEANPTAVWSFTID